MSEMDRQILTAPPAIKPPVDPAELAHKDLRDDDYWRAIPAYADLSGEEFHDHRFQSRNSITSLKKLREVLGDCVGESFYKDVEEGLMLSPMALRISPYLMSLIDWRKPASDPLRIQFLPMSSRMLPDHPELSLDSLREQREEHI